MADPRYNRLPPKLPKPVELTPERPATTLSGQAAVDRLQEVTGDAQTVQDKATGVEAGAVVDVIKDVDNGELLFVTATALDNGAREEFDGLLSFGVLKTPDNGPNVEVLAIPAPEGVTLDTLNFVLASAELVWRNGAVGAPPKANEIAQLSGVPIDIVREVMITEAYKVGCKARGIAPGEMPGLTPRQVTALQIIMDPTAGVSLDRRLKKAGVSVQEYNSWKKNKAFASQVEKMRNVLENYEDDIITSLAGMAVSGDLASIKFALEVSGRHNPQDQNSMAVREVLAIVLEILQTEIDDPAILAKIGTQMQSLAIRSGAFASGPPKTIKEIEG